MPTKYKEMNPEQKKALAVLVIARYEKGDKMDDMAQEHGVSTTTLYKLLIREQGDNWKEVQAARELWQYEHAIAQMKEAKDHLELAKWDKLSARHQWGLERLMSKHYGQKQEPGSGQAISINIGVWRPPAGENVVAEIVQEPKAAPVSQIEQQPVKPLKLKNLSPPTKTEAPELVYPDLGIR